MPKLRRRPKKNERYRKLTDADNGLKVTKGISEAFKKSKRPRSDVKPNPPNHGTDAAAEEVSPVKTQQEIDEILRQFDLDWRFGPSIGWLYHWVVN